MKKGHRIDIAKWMYVPRDWVCVRTRENNLLMTSSVRHVDYFNDIYMLFKNIHMLLDQYVV